MAKILTNTTVSDVFVTDTGTTIPASSTYTIPPQFYGMWVNSANIVTLITAGTITVANGLRSLPTTALMIAELATIQGLAEDTAFDNSSNGYTAVAIQAAIEETRYLLTIPTTDQAVYVTKRGNDTTGNGSFGRPYLTVSKALTSITDSSPAKRYSVDVGPGDYSENIVLKANVFIKGSGPIATRITGSTININDASWNNSSNDSRSGLQDISANGVASWDFTAQAGNTQGKLYFFNVRNAAAWTFTGLNAINQIIIQDSEFFGTTTFNGMTAFASSTAWQSGNLVVNSSALTGVPASITVNGGMVLGNITATWTSNSAVTVNLAGIAIGTSTVLSGSGASCSVFVNDGSLPIPANRSLASGATLTRINDNFAQGLISATTNVDSSASAAPTAGQALVATGSAAAAWSNVVALNAIEVSATADATTTSNTPALLTTMTVTPTPGKYMVWFSASTTSNGTNCTATFALYNNGTIKSDSSRTIQPYDGGTLAAATATGSVAINAIITVTAGSVEIHWSTSGGTATCHQRTLNLLRIG